MATAKTLELSADQSCASENLEAGSRKEKGIESAPRPRPPLLSKHFCLAFGLGLSVPILFNAGAWLLSMNTGPKDVNGWAAVSPTEVTAVTSAPALTLDPSLSATRSTLTGVVDPRTLSTSYYWSMTLADSSTLAANKQASMELNLPDGAVVSRATLWVNGHAEEAAFNSTAHVQNAYNWVAVHHRDPLLVTQKPDGHVLVQMSPVPTRGEEVRLQLGISAPVAVKNSNTLRFPMPKVLHSNFKIEKQDVHLESPVPIFANSAKFKNTGTAGHFIFKGNIESTDELNNLQLQAAKPADLPVQFATRATHSDKGTYIVASLRNENASAEPKLVLEKVLSKPDCTIVNSEPAAHRISSLWAGQEISRIYKSDLATAVSLGTAYRVVSPVTGAVVLETEADYKHGKLHRDRYQTVSYASAIAGSTAPLAQFSAGSNASGPQEFADSVASDSTAVTGVNTAGTMRVNNLADLEAGLNLLANGLEIFGIAWGGPTMIMGFMQMAGGTQSAMKRVLWGAASCTGGLAVPGCINWLVASARDGNLFS